MCARLAAVLAGLALLFPPAAIAARWETMPLTEAGFAPDLGEQLDAAVGRGELPNLHAVVVVRFGRLALERYYEGPDERWGEPLGEVAFGPDVLHDLRSVSKSIVGLLYGIALDEGLAAPLDAPLVDEFPYADLRDDPARRRMTVAHALTMTLGTAWDESSPYSDVENSEIAMELAEDRYRFVLSRPIVAEPGSTWVYNGGTTAVLAHLIAQSTGRPLLDYAKEKLFDPLGIREVDWVEGTNGEPAAASGLRLRPRDLAKIGQLVLDRGRFGNEQVVPRTWIYASTRRHTEAEDGLGYGYQWWLGQGRVDGRHWFAGFGNGGQRVVVVPDLDLVVAILAGNYNQPDAWQVSVRIMAEILLPAIRE